MVNKVDGNGYYVYPKQKNLEISNTGGQFNLDSKKNGVSSGERDKTEGKSSDKAEREEQLGVKLELSSNGQSAGAERQKQADKASEHGAAEQKPLLETIQEFVVKAIAAVQDFFRRLWNDQPGESVSRGAEESGSESLELGVELAESDLEPGESGVEPVEPGLETTEAAGASAADMTDSIKVFEAADAEGMGEADFPVDEESRNRKIQQSLRNGDIEQVISLLTENGKRTVAKNSTLLTSYDRNGRVVESNASDRQRVLYGDKNSLKL